MNKYQSCYHNGFCRYPLAYLFVITAYSIKFVDYVLQEKPEEKKSIPDNIYHKLVFDLDNFTINNIYVIIDNGWFEALFCQIYFRSTELKVYKNKESDGKLIQ